MAEGLLESSESLTFVLQNYLPLPEDWEKCPVRKIEIASTDTVESLQTIHYKRVMCGSTAEWLALPYQAYDESPIVIQPTIHCTPDLDIVAINKGLIVIAKSLKECYKQDYQGIFRMRQLPSTHAGYVILELIFRQHQPSGPCQFCGRANCDKLRTFLSLDLEDGSQVQCLRSGVRMPENKEGVKQGPAYTTSIPSENYGNFDTDNVDAIPCPEWPPMANGWPSRDRNSNWPSSILIDKILKTSCLVVPVSHSKSLHPDYEWRLSFSQAEVCLARSLSDVQRKCYLIVKTFFKTSLREPAVLSTYHLKTLMFWQCERIPGNKWQKSNMAGCVIGLIDSLLKSLSVKNIPHYFIPEHNLIDHIDPNDTETIKVKVEDLRANLCQYLTDGFIALMPCCVQGKTIICVKEIFDEVFKHCRTGNILSSSDRISFLLDLARYYFVLGRYLLTADLFTVYYKMIHRGGENQQRLTTGHPRKSEKPPPEFLIDMGLRIAYEPTSAFNYVTGAKFSHDYDDNERIEVRNQMVWLNYALLPWHIQDDQFIQVIREDFKRKMSELMVKNKGNPESAAISAYIMWQLGDAEDALEEVKKGLSILTAASQPQLHLPVGDRRLDESECETESVIGQSNSLSPDVCGSSCHKKDAPMAENKADLSLAQNKASQQAEIYHLQNFSHAPNTVLFYDVHMNSLDETLKHAIQSRGDRNPVAMPTELLLLYTRYKCLLEKQDTEMADITRREILETMDKKYANLSVNEVNMIKSICSMEY